MVAVIVDDAELVCGGLFTFSELVDCCLDDGFCFFDDSDGFGAVVGLERLFEI